MRPRLTETVRVKSLVNRQKLVITRPSTDRAPFSNSLAAILSRQRLSPSWEHPGSSPVYQPTLVARQSTGLSTGYPEMKSRAMSSVK